MNQSHRNRKKNKKTNKVAAPINNTVTNRSRLQSLSDEKNPKSGHRNRKESNATQSNQVLFEDRNDQSQNSLTTNLNNTLKNQLGASSHSKSSKNKPSRNDMHNQQEYDVMTLLVQVRTLIWRNWIVFCRKKKIFMFMILTPIMICFMLRYMVIVVETLKWDGVGSGNQLLIGKLPKCQNPKWVKEGDQQCATVGYSIIGDKRKDREGQYQYIHDLMKLVAENNDLEYGKDVKTLTVGKSSDFQNYVQNNKNMTQYAIIFCADSWAEEVEIQTMGNRDQFNQSMSKEEKMKSSSIKFDFYMPCKFDYHPEKEMIFYSLLYNMSLSENSFLKSLDKPFATDNNLLSLKVSIDNAVLETKARQYGMENIPEIEISYQQYPYVPDRFYAAADPVVTTGSFYLVLVPLTVFMIIYEEMTREKANNLRMGLLLIGCSNAAYWIAWTITGLIFSAIMSCLMYIVGYLFGFNFFLVSPFYVIFLILFIVSIGELSFAFLLVTLMQNQSTAYTVCYTFILVSIITTMALIDPLAIYKLFFNLDMPEWTIYFRWAFELLPTFHFNKLYGDITRITCFHFTVENMLWVPGREWEHEDMFKEVHGQFMTLEKFIVPSMYHTFQKILMNSVAYFIIALYFDITLSHNRGTSQPFYFFLMPSYWFKSCANRYKSQQKPIKIRTVQKQEKSHNKSINTAVQEKKLIKMEEREQKKCRGVRMLGVSKSYNKDCEALKNVYLEVGEGELLGIMGHNGAGKTTLINVLSGYVSITHGNARIFDTMLDQDLQTIRRRMGVVSQFDVLWDELTALEHMYLFSQIKRVYRTNLPHFFTKRLRDVGLLESANLQVGKYSGGMRRRMSVALSSIGDPSVILMDEPTTGMDPVSRKQVWDLIQRLKKKRVVIMTTHAMEEAEMLSDKLAVLNHGELRCVGTPLQLKNLLGKGYRVNLVCNKKHVNLVKSLFKTVVPSSEFYETSGDSGSLLYNVPMDKVKELGSVFKLIDNKKKPTPDDEEEQTISIHERKALVNLRKLVKDVGVSQTTLEEVFMAATKDDITQI